LVVFDLSVPPGHHDAVRLLLSKGVPVDPINKRGTPLHLAAAMDHDKVVKILLEHGADVSRNYHSSLSCCTGHLAHLEWLLYNNGYSFPFAAQQSCQSWYFTAHDGLFWPLFEMHEAIG
jgi:ankyrin repeat protein